MQQQGITAGNKFAHELSFFEHAVHIVHKQFKHRVNYSVIMLYVLTKLRWSWELLITRRLLNKMIKLI